MNLFIYFLDFTPQAISMSILSLSNMDVNWYTDVPKDVREILLESVMISVAHSTKTLLDAKMIHTSNSEKIDDDEKSFSNDNNYDNDSKDANNNTDIIKESKARHKDDSVSNNNRSFSLPDNSSILILKSVSNILYGFGALDLKWMNLDQGMQEKFLILLTLLLDGEDPVNPLKIQLKNDKRSGRSAKKTNENEIGSEDDNEHEDESIGVRVMEEKASLTSSNLKFLINSLARVGLDFASSSSSTSSSPSSSPPSSSSSSSSSYSTHTPHLESADEDKPQLKLMLMLRHSLTSSFIRFAIPNESLQVEVEVEVEDISSIESVQDGAYAEPKESDVMTSSDFFSSLLSLGSTILLHLFLIFISICVFYLIVLLSVMHCSN